MNVFWKHFTLIIITHHHHTHSFIISAGYTLVYKQYTIEKKTLFLLFLFLLQFSMLYMVLNIFINIFLCTIFIRWRACCCCCCQCCCYHHLLFTDDNNVHELRAGCCFFFCSTPLFLLTRTLGAIHTRFH